MPDRNAVWIREQIAAHTPEAVIGASADTPGAAIDPATGFAAALQLAHAWAALSGQGTHIFGMEIPAELAERDSLRDECFAVLRSWIPLLDKPNKEQLRQVMTGYTVPLVKS